MGGSRKEGRGLGRAWGEPDVQGCGRAGGTEVEGGARGTGRAHDGGGGRERHHPRAAGGTRRGRHHGGSAVGGSCGGERPAGVIPPRLRLPTRGRGDRQTAARALAPSRRRATVASNGEGRGQTAGGGSSGGSDPSRRRPSLPTLARHRQTPQRARGSDKGKKKAAAPRGALAAPLNAGVRRGGGELSLATPLAGALPAGAPGV